MEISHPLDCNVYLLDGGGRYALIDAGCGIESERIAGNIEQLGIPKDRVDLLILTHAHGDHAAGARYFRDYYGLQVAVSDEAAPWLEQGDRNKTSVDLAVKGGMYPPNYRYEACPVDIRLRDLDTVTVGGVQILALETNGHSRGHLSFYWEDGSRKSLFSGDAVFARGRVVLQNIWDCSIEQYAATMAKLHALQPDSLYAGHGPFLLNNAHRHIESAVQCFDKLGIPPNY